MTKLFNVGDEIVVTSMGNGDTKEAHHHTKVGHKGIINKIHYYIGDDEKYSWYSCTDLRGNDIFNVYHVNCELVQKELLNSTDEITNFLNTINLCGIETSVLISKDKYEICFGDLVFDSVSTEVFKKHMAALLCLCSKD